MKMQLIMKEGMQLKFLRGGNSCDEIFTNRWGISSDGEEIFGKCYENGMMKRSSRGKC